MTCRYVTCDSLPVTSDSLPVTYDSLPVTCDSLPVTCVLEAIIISLFEPCVLNHWLFSRKSERKGRAPNFPFEF